MDTTHLILSVVLMALVTYLPRALPMQVDTDHWPKWLHQVIGFLPVAIIAAITVPSLVVHAKTLTFFNVQMFAAIPTLICAHYTRNLMLSVIVGTSVYIILQTWF